MTNTNKSPSPFAEKDDEAKKRFERFQSLDPFPDIIPALLNSADIYDYVHATGMICPFDIHKLKSASYAVPILGKAVYWDEQNNKIVEHIGKGDTFTLRPNSIAFVTLEPMFRLPDYIAFRFNLKITNVYRGILLGTGPLVDPGFIGKLSIPLHNLTTNEYIFKGGEDLIWMEFTKLSKYQEWYENNDDNTIIRPVKIGQYVPFPPDKALPDVEGYLEKADKHRSIRSSIPEAFRNAEEASKNANSTVKFFQQAGTISAIALIIALGALFFQVYALVEDSNYYVNTAQKDINQVQSQLTLINQFQSEIQYLKQEIQDLKQEIRDLKQEKKEIQDKISK